MYYMSEVVKVLDCKYKGKAGVVLDSNRTHVPTLYEVAMENGVVIALYEPELELLEEEG